MYSDFFTDIKKELDAAMEDPSHPYRTGTLGTVGVEYMPRLRTIVLREIDESMRITFYSDRRSKKITHIHENPKVALLLYNPKSRIQLKIEGAAKVEKDIEILKTHWKKIGAKNKKDYTTIAAPGSDIPNLKDIDYMNEGNYFSMVYLIPFKIEYLKLGQEKHTRIRFSREREAWNGEMIVP